MMNRETSWETTGGCPKRVWVLQTLADDEARQENPELFQGLRSHLRHCQSCRAVAASIEGISTGLAALGAMEVDDGLARRASAQLQTALENGAVMSGRVRLDADDGPTAPERSTGRPIRLFVPLAAAAGLAITFTLFQLRPGDPATGRLIGPSATLVGHVPGEPNRPADVDSTTPGAAYTAQAHPVASVGGVPIYADPTVAAELADGGNVQAAFTIQTSGSRVLSLFVDKISFPGSTRASPPPEQP